MKTTTSPPQPDATALRIKEDYEWTNFPFADLFDGKINWGFKKRAAGNDGGSMPIRL